MSYLNIDGSEPGERCIVRFYNRANATFFFSFFSFSPLLSFPRSGALNHLVYRRVTPAGKSHVLVATSSGHRRYSYLLFTFDKKSSPALRNRSSSGFRIVDIIVESLPAEYNAAYCYRDARFGARTDRVGSNRGTRKEKEKFFRSIDPLPRKTKNEGSSGRGFSRGIRVRYKFGKEASLEGRCRSQPASRERSNRPQDPMFEQPRLARRVVESYQARFAQYRYLIIAPRLFRPDSKHTFVRAKKKRVSQRRRYRSLEYLGTRRCSIHVATCASSGSSGSSGSSDASLSSFSFSPVSEGFRNKAFTKARGARLPIRTSIDVLIPFRAASLRPRFDGP